MQVCVHGSFPGQVLGLCVCAGTSSAAHTPDACFAVRASSSAAWSTAPVVSISIGSIKIWPTGFTSCCTTTSAFFALFARMRVERLIQQGARLIPHHLCWAEGMAAFGFSISK